MRCWCGPGVVSAASTDPATRGPRQDIYVWKTDKAWAGTCRQLDVKLNDGTTHSAKFNAPMYVPAGTTVCSSRDQAPAPKHLARGRVGGAHFAGNHPRILRVEVRPCACEYGCRGRRPRPRARGARIGQLGGRTRCVSSGQPTRRKLTACGSSLLGSGHFDPSVAAG